MTSRSSPPIPITHSAAPTLVSLNPIDGLLSFTMSSTSKFPRPKPVKLSPETQSLLSPAHRDPSTITSSFCTMSAWSKRGVDRLNPAKVNRTPRYLFMDTPCLES